MTTTGINWNADLGLDAQDELAAVLALAPAISDQTRREIDRARTAAMKAVILATYPGIRIPGRDEPVPDGIGAEAEPGEFYGEACGLDECDCDSYAGE